MAQRLVKDILKEELIYVGLFTDDNTEVESRVYKRRPVRFKQVDTGPEYALFENVTEVTFPKADRDWGNITHVGLFTEGGTKLLLQPFNEENFVYKTAVYNIKPTGLSVKFVNK